MASAEPRDIGEMIDDWNVAMNNLRAAISEIPWWIRWVMYLLYPFLRFKEEDDGLNET